MSHTSGNGNVGWREVFDRLRSEIESGVFRSGEKMPTEAQLVKDLGASKMTVHRALAELAAAGLVRRVERVGTFVADTAAPNSTRGKIGLFLPTNFGFLEIRLISGIQEAAGEDRQIVLYATDSDPVLEAEVLQKSVGEVEGILILPTGHPRTSRRLQEINDSGCPVVCIDRLPQETQLPCVASDNYAATKSAVEMLAQSGHRRIAYFGLYAPEVSSLVERYQGFSDAMQGLGVEDPTSLARFIEPRGSEELFIELRFYEDAILRLTSGPEPVTAAFCANEHNLTVLLEVCQSMPADMRERFEIVAFCDWPILSSPCVRTHVIRQDAKTVGKRAAEHLYRALAGETVPPTREEVSTHLEKSVGSMALGLGPGKAGGQ